MSLDNSQPGLTPELRAILVKIAGGETVSLEDQALIQVEVAGPHKAGVREGGGAETFSLTGEAGTARWPYEKRCVDYAEIYQTDVRNIKKWIAKGRTVTPVDLPPFDDVIGMPGWWSRRMVHRVPEKILTLAREARSTASAPLAPSCNVATPVPLAGDKIPPAVEVDMGARLSRLQAAERAAWTAYQASITVEPAAAELRRRAWSELVDVLRKEEAAEDARAKTRGGFLTRAEVVADLKVIHGTLSKKLRTFMRDVQPKLDGLAKSEQLVVYEAELDTFFKSLQEANAFAVGFA